MKRTNKKLTLRSETLRSLTPEQMGDAAGGTIISRLNLNSVLIACPYTSILTKPSLVDGCPSALGCTTTIVVNPYIIKY